MSSDFTKVDGRGRREEGNPSLNVKSEYREGHKGRRRGKGEYQEIILECVD